MAEIKVREVGSGKDSFDYEVEVVEGENSTSHRVRVRKEDYERLTGGRITPAVLVEKSFVFLLGREPKESILRSFDLNVISAYFRDYPRLIKGYF